MTRDQEIYNILLKRFLETVPRTAQKVLLRVEFDPEGYICKYIHEYIDHNHELGWFDLDTWYDVNINDLFWELRNYFLKDYKKTLSKLKYTVDVLNKSFNVELEYENLV